MKVLLIIITVIARLDEAIAFIKKAKPLLHRVKQFLER